MMQAASRQTNIFRLPRAHIFSALGNTFLYRKPKIKTPPRSVADTVFSFRFFDFRFKKKVTRKRGKDFEKRKG